MTGLSPGATVSKGFAWAICLSFQCRALSAPAPSSINGAERPTTNRDGGGGPNRSTDRTRSRQRLLGVKPTLFPNREARGRATSPPEPDS